MWVYAFVMRRSIPGLPCHKYRYVHVEFRRRPVSNIHHIVDEDRYESRGLPEVRPVLFGGTPAAWPPARRAIPAAGPRVGSPLKNKILIKIDRIMY